jgi:tRNA 2-thiouridine synthesizing protein A
LKLLFTYNILLLRNGGIIAFGRQANWLVIIADVARKLPYSVGALQRSHLLLWRSLLADKTLDARGLTCPLPILKAKKALADVPVGGTLEVLATDPGAVEDFQAFARSTGNTLVEQTEAAGVYRSLIKRNV